MAQLREMFLDTDPVFWTIVEYRKKLSHLYTFTTPEDGRFYFEELVHEMLQENVPPQIRNFARTMERWKPEILNSLQVLSTPWHGTCDGNVTRRHHRLNNVLMENRNGIIKVVTNTANGYSNFPRFRNRLLYVMRKDACYDLTRDFREVNKSLCRKKKKKDEEDKE